MPQVTLVAYSVPPSVTSIPYLPLSANVPPNAATIVEPVPLIRMPDRPLPLLFDGPLMTLFKVTKFALEI